MRDLCLATLLVICAALPSAAQEDLTGVYRLDGYHYATWTEKEDVVVDVWLRLRPDGTYDVARQHTFADGVQGTMMLGDGRVVGDALQVRWTQKRGARDALVGVGEDTGPMTAEYTLGPDRGLTGTSHALQREGLVATFWERGGWRAALPAGGASGSEADGSGSEADGSGGEADGSGGEAEGETQDETGAGDDAGAETGSTLSGIEVAGVPDGGVYLVGHQLPLSAPARVVAGPAAIAGTTLTLQSPGAVVVAGDDGAEATIHAVEARIRSITVLDALPIEDADPPHWRAPSGEATEPSWEPALLLMNQPLELRVVLEADRDLTSPARITLRGQAGEHVLSARTQVDQLAGGHAVELSAAEALSDGVRINQVDLAWSLRGERGERELAALPATSLRVYTTFARPRTNRIRRHADSKPAATKLHLELVCTWAEGASEHVATGPSSICEALDNGMRHLVHPSDHGATPPPVPHYAADAPKPLNYDLIPADTGGNVMNGRRMASSLFYPDRKVDYENHYRENYGWYVLENPQYTGGRCNQQASLVADMFGTAGVPATVFYIERKGMGRETGKTMLRYFVSAESGKSWNFHGVAQVTLPDGRPWLYDGSGSRPPERINGSPDEVLRNDGPFVDYWKSYWKYYDSKEVVPETDWPTEYIGKTGRLEKGQWKGVPLQEGEQPLRPSSE